MYRIGFPGWKLVAKLGVPLLLRIDVQRDDEAKVFIATSPDLDGLVVEAATVEDLFRETHNCVCMLLEDQLNQRPRELPRVAWPGNLLAA